MAKPSSTAKLVITSIIISIIVLAVFVLIFINSIVPAYQVTADQIYSVLTKIFPILIGLLLIQVGVMAAKKGEPEYKDTIDKLSPNAYDSALYTAAKDDPAKAAAPAEKTIEVVKEVPVEVIKTVEVPVEVVREVEKRVEVPVEVLKEVPVEIVREVQVPVEIVREVVKEVPVEVVREVPVEVIKEVEVEKPVEVVKEVEVGEKSVQLDFRQVLEAEAKDAISYGYDLSVAAISGDTTEEAIEASFGEDTLVFSENGLFYAVLPLYNRDEARAALQDFSIVNIATLDGRDVQPDTLIREASQA